MEKYAVSEDDEIEVKAKEIQKVAGIKTVDARAIAASSKNKE